MIFDPSTESHLKSWLVRTLEPICDAEPTALANYVVALLKHSGPEAEMRKDLTVQLEEFLEKEGPSFIDTLFTVLRTKSYLPYQAASPPPASTPIDNGIPIPLDGLISPSIPSPDRGRKRSFDYDDRDAHPPSKTPRLRNDPQFSRYSNGRPERGGGFGAARGDRYDRERRDYSEGADGGIGGGMNGRGRGGAYQPPEPLKKGICRDYFHKGYCARGAMCKYSHGEDAIVPNQLFPPMQGGPLPFLPIFPNGAPFAAGGGAYDPHERMDIAPGARPPRPPLLSRVQQEGGGSQVVNTPASGELPVIQDLTPRVPPGEAGQQAQPQQHRQNGRGDGFRPRQPTVGPQPMNVDTPHGAPTPLPGGGRGRPRDHRSGGTFPSPVPTFRPPRSSSTQTLVVEKIPPEKLSLESVNKWFKRFGTVTNVAVDAARGKALVSFASHDDAHRAWSAEEAVFGNRFVKVFWHRPMQGHGQVGQRMLAASAPLVANMGARPTPAPAPQASTSTTPAPAAAPNNTAATTATTATTPTPQKTPAAAALAAKQQLLERQIAEQKSLMEKLGSVSGQEKKDVLARLRKLGEEMKAPAPAPVSPARKVTPTPAPKSEEQERLERERLERERLDRELELHAATSAAEGGAGESTEELKAKLERLKAEAASLGIPETAYSAAAPTSYRPYRGRARGSRSYYRGAMRGGPPRTSMKLDNRPKKLLVKGAGVDNVQSVRDWYETTGQVDAVETVENDDIVVSFRSRNAAEQGWAKGNNIPIVGQVQVSWYTGRSGTVVKAESPSSPTDLTDARGDNHIQDSESHDPHHTHDEEVVAGGWGDDDDGMGLM